MVHETRALLLDEPLCKLGPLRNADSFTVRLLRLIDQHCVQPTSLPILPRKQVTQPDMMVRYGRKLIHGV